MTNPSKPFEGSRSNTLLTNWLSELDKVRTANRVLMNITSTVTPANRPLTRTEIKSCLDGLKDQMEDIRECRGRLDMIITLGNAAKYAVEQMFNDERPPTIYMPHPSPRNFKVNDVPFVRAQLRYMVTKYRQVVGGIEHDFNFNQNCFYNRSRHAAIE
jgi:uracil-DNA glycosylase